MSIYYITIILVSFFCFLAKTFDYKTVQVDILNRNKHSQATMIFYIVAVCVLVFVAGFRYRVGTDFGGYYLYYEKYANEFWRHLITFDEPGFRFICWVTVFIKGNGTTAIFLSAAITAILFLKTIYKNTDCLLSATLLYIFLGCWHGSFNGIRQYLAAAVIFSGIRYIKEKCLWKYVITVFIAFLFHTSAILMIFAYFIAHNKINLKNILFLILGSLIVLFSFSEISEFVGVILQEDLSNEGVYLTNTVNIFRVLVAIAPAVFFLIFYWKKQMTVEQRMWLNLLILNGIIMLATSNSTYFARMGIYTDTFTAIAIPELSKRFSYKNRVIIKTVILILYAAFWLYEISISSALNNFTFIWQK